MYAKYESISEILDGCPEIQELVHRDLEQALDKVNRVSERESGCTYTSDSVLRILLVQAIECLPLRKLVVRIDDSRFFPVFTRLGNRPMMSLSHVDRLKNAVDPDTWQAINYRLAKHVESEEWISGESLRLDTTAVESNVHFLAWSRSGDFVPHESRRTSRERTNQPCSVPQPKEAGPWPPAATHGPTGPERPQPQEVAHPNAFAADWPAAPPRSLRPE